MNILRKFSIILVAISVYLSTSLNAWSTPGPVLYYNGANLAGGGSSSPVSLQGSGFANNEAIRYAQVTVSVNSDANFQIQGVDLSGESGAHFNVVGIATNSVTTVTSTIAGTIDGWLGNIATANSSFNETFGGGGGTNGVGNLIESNMTSLGMDTSGTIVASSPFHALINSSSISVSSYIPNIAVYYQALIQSTDNTIAQQTAAGNMQTALDALKSYLQGLTPSTVSSFDALQSATSQLGSVINTGPGNIPLAVTLSGDNTLVLTGDVNPAWSAVANAGTGGSEVKITNGAPNSVYNYIVAFVDNYFVTDANGYYDNGNVPAAPSTLVGPYNQYSKVSWTLGTGGSTLVVKSVAGNIGETVLSSTFLSFADTSATLDIETNTTVTDASFAGQDSNHQFGSITGAGGATLTINIQTHNANPLGAGANSITLNNVWTNTGGGSIDINGNWVSGTAYLDTLKIQSPVTITDGSIRHVNLVVDSAAVATITPSAANITVNAELLDEDATLKLSSVNGQAQFSGTVTPHLDGLGTVILAADGHDVVAGGSLSLGSLVSSVSTRACRQIKVATSGELL